MALKSRRKVNLEPIKPLYIPGNVIKTETNISPAMNHVNSSAQNSRSIKEMEFSELSSKNKSSFMDSFLFSRVPKGL